jgi:hypothetical protein
MRQYFLQGLLKNKDKTLVQTFNSNIRYIDDVLSLNNYRFADYLHRICPNEHGVKDTTDTQRSASYLAIDNRGRIKKKKLYDNRDDFPFISSNIPASPAYGVYVSQLLRHSRALCPVQ